ncbi:hypothetical protein HYX14_00460 [Candidatus Woesearchaeota archaeon]|nr:hypothetical protein [Candidatus Woesearchaeota archaeon]
MSLLADIRKTIQENPEVVLVHEREKPDNLPDKLSTLYSFPVLIDSDDPTNRSLDNPVLHSVILYVASARPLYDLGKLNSLLDRLVPNYQCTKSEHFLRYENVDEQTLRVGWLMYHEPIAIAHRSVTQRIELQEEGLPSGVLERLTREGFQQEKTWVEKSEYRRRTKVYLYPDEDVARQVVDQNSSMFGYTIIPYAPPKPPQRGLIARIFGTG